MERIKKLKEDVISTLKIKENHEDIINNIKIANSKDWLKEYYKGEVFEDSRLDIEYQDLITDKEKAIETDFENAKIIYEMFSKFSDAETCDESFWMGLTFGRYFEYMKYRWPLEKEKNYELHWVFPYDSKRSLFFNGLSRLYWFVKYTYDETLEDPYEITRFCFTDVNTFNELVYRSYSNSFDVRLALLKALKKYKETFGKLGGSVIRYGAICMSFFGGAYLLDSFTQEELKDKIYQKLLKFKEGQESEKDAKFKL